MEQREIEQYEDEQDPMVRGTWAIQTPQSADWAMGRLADCEAEVAQIEAQYEAAVARLVARKETLISRAQRGAGFFRFKLEEWANRNRAVLIKGQRKSVALLHGHIGWRKKGGGLRVEDKVALLEWLSTQPVESSLYRIKLEPEMDALQRYYTETHQVPPGCKYVEETDTFYAKPIEASEGALMKGE